MNESDHSYSLADLTSIIIDRLSKLTVQITLSVSTLTLTCTDKKTGKKFS